MAEPQQSFTEPPKGVEVIKQQPEPPKSFTEIPEGAVLEPPKSFTEVPEGIKLEDDLSIDEIKKMQAEGVKLSDKLQRKLFKADDERTFMDKVSGAADAFIPAAADIIGQTASGAVELANKAVVQPAAFALSGGYGRLDSEEAKKVFKEREEAIRSLGVGAAKDIEETVNAAVRFGMFGSATTDKLLGKSEEERFRAWQNRQAMRELEAQEAEQNPDRVAALLSQNPLIQGYVEYEAKKMGLSPEEVEKVKQDYIQTMLDQGLTKDQINQNISALGEFVSPVAIPGGGRLSGAVLKPLSKVTAPVMNKATELAVRGTSKLAQGTEYAANKVLQGTELLQTGAKKIGEYAINDPDTFIRGTVNTAILPVVGVAKPVSATARVIRDITNIDVGGTAGRRGMVEMAGQRIDSSDLTKRLFGSQGKGGVARAKLADWTIRQSNALIQPGVNAAAMNVVMGLPDIETAEDLGFSAGTGFGIGSLAGTRSYERIGGLIDPRTTMAQKITNLVTPDPAAYRRDEDADIKRFMAQASPEIQKNIADLSNIESRKAAVEAAISNLEKERDAQINPDDAAFKQKQIDGFIKQREALAKATPETQAEATRQTALAFIDAYDLAQSTGGVAGLRGVKIAVLDPANADQFFRDLYGDSLKQAETTINLLTGIPSLTETDSTKLNEARQLLQKFQNDVEGAKSARGFALQEDNTDPNSEGFVPPHLRRVNQQGATAVINADLIKHMTSQGLNLRHTLQHEVQHAVQQFAEVNKMLAPIRGQLFDQKIKNDDGSVEVYQQGIYSDEDLDRYATQYAKMMSPSDNGASFYAQFGGEVEKMRAYIKDEILAETAAATGEYAGGTRASLDDVGRNVMDWLEVKTKSGRLKQLKETLRKNGIIFDNVGGYSAVLGAQMSPETLAMVRQYQRGLKDFDGTMTVQQSRESDEPDIPLTKVLGSVALQNKYRHADFFEKEQIIKATAPDGSVTEIVVPAGAKIDPFIDVYRTQNGQLVDANGNVVTLGPEITFGSMPDGTTFETDTRIARKSNGSPIILTNREMKARARKRTEIIQNAIDSAKDDGSGVRLSDTGNGNYRGVMSPAQIEAFMALPNEVVSPNLKRMTKFFNELMARGDGTRVVMEYQAALLNGKYKALSPKIRDEVPIGFQITQDGNFALTTISVSRLYDKMQAWADKKPENLQPWNGDTGAFWDSLIKLLDNHSRGEKGETGLHPDAYIAGKMKNKINDLFNAYNAETKQSNPDRSTLPRARGKDNLDIVIRSRRLDRINNFSESPSQKLPINYGYLTTNYMPAVNPMAAPMTAEEVQNRFDGSVTATRVRRAMATGEIDALESELRQMDDLLPTESLQLVQGEDQMPKIQIVSMFDPENVASLEPEEIVSDIDAETEAELAILDAQDGTVPPQDIAKVLSTKLDQLYADGGRSPIIPALESELEKIYQQLESQAQEQAAATEDIVEAPEVTEVDIMNSPTDLIAQAVEAYNTGRVDNATQTLPEYIRSVVNEAGALQIPPDVTDGQIMAAVNDAVQSRDSLKQRIQGGTQFMPAGEIEAPSGERGFKSKLQSEIQRKFQGATATPEQLKAVITNPQNVKQEEVKWSGVLDAIDRIAGENSGKVPVAELMDYLRNEGQVKFEEVTLGKDRSVEDIADTYRIKIEDQYGEAAFYDEFDEPLEFDELPFALQNAIDKASKLPAPKYAQYQLPGGKNYREVVMAMPKSKEFLTKSELDEYQKLRFETETRTPQQQARLNQLLIRISENNAASRDDKSYTSSHFTNVQNYVAHMRLNERTDAEGNDGLFIEELQSDRHQAGREKGYLTSPKGWTAKQTGKVGSNLTWSVFDAEGNLVTDGMAGDSAESAIEYAFKRESSSVVGKVPDAPFRKDWPLQLFKRALRDAVESGKQWIGWTTGIEQVKRYEEAMRQVVDEITWEKPKGDQIRTFAAFKNGGITNIVNSNGEILSTYDQSDPVKRRELAQKWIEFNKSTYPDARLEEANRTTVLSGKIKDDGSVYDSTISDANGKQLSEVVGKEIAAKILSEDSGTAKGNDLTVGGEGMKGFYDTILPKEIGKYVAKMGGKVEKNRIIVTDMPASEYEKYPDGHPYKEKNNPQIWRVNITPEMENVVSAGQLQFMPAVAVVPERFTGTGEKGEERRGRYVAPPEFWTKFDIDEFERGGKFFDLETGEDVTDKTYGTGTIDVTGKRPSLVSESSIDEMPVEKGRTWKTNLFRKSAGWKWISENPPEIASIGSKEKPDPVLISVEASGGDHFYALKTEFPNGVQLARYPDRGNEPRLRPTRKGKIQLGDEVGRIRTSKGKEHPVYDTITIGQPQFMPAEVDYPSVGININSKTQDFTDQILRGEKTIETRPSNSLKSLVGKRVGIVRTGKGKATLVGYANIEEPIVYNNVDEFRADQDKHLVEADSEFDIKPNQKKYGYPLTNVESIEPIEVPSNLPNWYSARSIPQTQFMPAGEGLPLSDATAPERQQQVEKPLSMVRLSDAPEPPKKYAFAYTTSSDRIPLVDAFVKAKNWQAIRDLNQATIRHAMSDLPNVKYTMKDLVGAFENEREISVMPEFEINSPEELAEVRKRMVSLAELWQQTEVLEEQVGGGDQNLLGTVDNDGYLHIGKAVLTFDKLTPALVEKARQASGIQAMSYDNNSVIFYDTDNNETEFGRRIREFRDFITKNGRILENFSGDSTRVRSYRNPNSPKAGSLYYNEDPIRLFGEGQLPDRLRSPVYRVVSELLGRPLPPPKDGRASYFVKEDVTPKQVKLQNAIANKQAAVVLNDKKNKDVIKAYEELNAELLKQFDALVAAGMTFNAAPDYDAYNSLYPDSASVIRDIRNNNNLVYLKTTPETFGPIQNGKRMDFSFHPILKDSGRTDASGNKMSYNDILRVVHDAIAHGIYSAQFGPVGEESAWNTHIRTIDNPWARWALTMETRAQNSWVNYQDKFLTEKKTGEDRMPLKKGDKGFVPASARDYAEQKFALIPLKYVLTGDAKVDKPVKDLMEEIGEKRAEGSPEKDPEWMPSKKEREKIYASIKQPQGTPKDLLKQASDVIGKLTRKDDAENVPVIVEKAWAEKKSKDEDAEDGTEDGVEDGEVITTSTAVLKDVVAYSLRGTPIVVRPLPNLLAENVKTKVSKNVLAIAEDKKKYLEYSNRVLTAADKLRKDPEMFTTPSGYLQFMRESGASGNLLMPPSQITQLVKNPNTILQLWQGGYHGNKTAPGTVAAAIAGLDSVNEMRDLFIQDGVNLGPTRLITGLHHMWGILSRQLDPYNQEALWMRMVSYRPVMEQLQLSIDGKFALTKGEWQMVVQNARKATKGDYQKAGNNATANANAFHLMLTKHNGKWQDLASIYKVSDPLVMTNAFWGLGVGATGIKNKVQRFIGLTFGIHGSVLDRWRFVGLNLPTAMKLTGKATPETYFNYYGRNKTIPEDPVGIYKSYGTVENGNSVFSTALYAGIDRTIQGVIDNSKEMRDFLGVHATPGGFHWVDWNCVKNEAVGHSSLDLTKEFLKRKGRNGTVDDFMEVVQTSTTFTRADQDGRIIDLVMKDGIFQVVEQK